MSQQSQMCFHGFSQELINMVSEVGLLQGHSRESAKRRGEMDPNAWRQT